MGLALIIKALFIIGVLYICAKIIAPFINDFFSPHKSKNSHDLDAMIKRKEDYLRVTGAAGAKKIESTHKNIENEAKSNKLDYQEIVKASFREGCLKQNKTNQDKVYLIELKKILALVDSLQWGQSEELSTIRKRFERNFDFAPDEKLLIRSIRLSLLHASLLNEKKFPTGYEDFAESIICATFHDILRSSFAQQECLEAQTLTKRWHTDLLTLQKSWLLWLHVRTKLGSAEFMSELVDHEEIFKANDLMSLFGIGPDSLPWKGMLSESGRPRRANDLIDSMKEELATINATAKLPEAENIKRKQALDLMGFEQVPAPGILSRRYKKLARLMHPDRLISRGFPERVMDRVNSNFRTLKAAYDLLKEETEQ